MRYAIFSDVHSNLEAFLTVINAYKKEKIDQYLFAGDIVGYAANPRECIALLKELNPFAVCGNHDWGVVGKTPIDYFNDYAKDAILWTKGALSQMDIDYLSNLEPVYMNQDLTVVHGSLDEPDSFEYILDTNSARKTLLLMKTNIGFVGHSHAPFIIYLEDDYAKVAKGDNIKLEPGKKYLINVGSVGQPRDFDSRACYCVYDSGQKSVELKRIRYDIKAAQKKILKEGLPKALASRLSSGT